MQRIQVYVPNQQVLSAELNTLVTYGAGDANNMHTSLGRGADMVEWMYDGATLGVGALVKVDGAMDYRDRLLTVLYQLPAGADEEPGAGNDYLLDGTPTLRKGYTGRGARDAGGVSAPTAGNPPVPASTVSWAMQLTANVWLYADPSAGALYLYNGTAGTLRSPVLTITASAPTGKRP